MGIPLGFRYKPQKGAKLYKLDVWPVSEGEWPLHPYCIEETIRDDYREFGERGCIYMIITLMQEGGIVYSCNGSDEFLVEAGDILVIPQGSPYYFHNRKGDLHYKKLVLELRGALLQSISTVLHLDRWLHFKPDNFDWYHEQLRKIGDMVEAAQDENLPCAMGMTYELLSVFSAVARSREPALKKLVSKAKTYLEDPSSMNISIADIAEKLGVCHSQLDKAFKHELGLSPQEYRMRKRSDLARRYLASTTMSIKEIAQRLGYANQLYFSNDFKRRSNYSPRKYRVLSQSSISSTGDS